MYQFRARMRAIWRAERIDDAQALAEKVFAEIPESGYGEIVMATLRAEASGLLSATASLGVRAGYRQLWRLPVVPVHDPGVAAPMSAGVRRSLPA